MRRPILPSPKCKKGGRPFLPAAAGGLELFLWRCLPRGRRGRWRSRSHRNSSWLLAEIPSRGSLAFW